MLAEVYTGQVDILKCFFYSHQFLQRPVKMQSLPSLAREGRFNGLVMTL